MGTVDLKLITFIGDSAAIEEDYLSADKLDFKI